MKEKKIASALKYDEEKNDAPEVVAQGQGVIAQKIIQVARENSVSVYKDRKLAQQLKNLKLGEEIPPELYKVVAEVLLFISNIDKK